MRRFLPTRPVAFAAAVVLSLPGPARASRGDATTETRAYPPPLAAPAAAQAADTVPPVRTLAGAVRRAVETHPSLEAARAAADAASAGLGTARADRLPGVAVRGSTIRFQEPMLVAPLHRFDPSAVPDFDETLVQGTLGVDWTLFDGGRRGAEVRQARARLDARDQEAREVEAALIQRTADAFLSVLSAREMVAAQERHEAALQAETDRASQLVTEGAEAELVLLRARAELAAARSEREAVRQRLHLAVVTLEELLDLPSGALDPGALAPPGLPPEALPERTRPDDAVPAVAAARHALAAAEARVQVSRSAWLPRVAAVGGYNLFAGGGVSPVWEWQGGLQLSYPLFTGGRRGSAVDGSRAAVREARARVAEASERATLASESARAAEREARARADALDAAVRQFTELARVERLALDEGVGVQSDWLRAEAGLFQARAGLAEAQHRVLAARIAWARATGGLDRSTIQLILEGTS